jgi:putative endonuclease
MHYVYILLLSGKYLYVGRTDDLKRRINEHLRGKTRSTRGREPRLIFYEAYAVKQDAIDRELFLKTGDGRQQVKKQLQHTLLVEDKALSSNG